MQLRDSVTAAVALMSSVASATLNICPPNGGGVCYSVGVPRSSAASGSGTIYMQIRAPTSFSWVALGTGSQMPGSNIFLIYQDGNGNVTVSPRLGARYVQPQLDTSSTAARLTLLAGSGVSADGSTMTANLACSNCQSWSGGGSMGLADTQTQWIGAWKAGSSLATTDKNANIRQHDDASVFTLDLSKAAIQSDANPFVGAGGGTGNDGASSGNNGGVSFGSGVGPGSLVLAHGAIMAILFVILYPLASMTMPLFGKWKLHAGAQTFNFILMWVGFGLGITVAKERSRLFTNTHTILGTVVVCLLILQPFLGYAHHMQYVKHQRRGAISYVHVFWGQSLMIVGIVNGGLGLQLTGVDSKFIIAYAVVAAVIFVLYAGVKVFALLKARRSSMSGDKMAPSPESPPQTRPYP